MELMSNLKIIFDKRHLYIKSRSINLQTIIDNFKTRVANDGGTFEAEANLLSILNSVNSSIGLSKVNMLFTPNARKAGIGYNVIGPTDFAVLRNTSATLRNSNKLVVTESNNIVRYDYPTINNPIILDEPQSSNIFVGSESTTQFFWAESIIAVSGVASPIENLNYPAVTSNNPNAGNKRFYKIGISVIAGSTYTLSFYAKYLNIQYLHVRTESGSQNIGIGIDIVNKTFFQGRYDGVNALQAPISFSYDDNDRFTITFVANTNSVNLLFYMSNSTGNSNNIQNPASIYFTGTMLEKQDNATSYIPTVGSIVTRNEDLITVSPPSGTVRITTTFLDNSTQILNTIPATFTLPTGQIRHVIFQKIL
jgi:hypothetical protein